MSLHDELSRLADTAPRPSIDHTVWDRGRALRRRDRLVTSAVVLALVVIIGGLASLVVGPPRTVAPADNTVPDGAIPSVIRDLPATMTGPLEGNVGIGRASAAFIASNGTPVVIGATDGKYHLLDLPELIDPAAIALSPSGDRLAFVSGSAERRTVIIWELLHRGFSQGYDIGANVKVQQLTWSPNGDWLAYAATLRNGNARTGRWQYPDGGELGGPLARHPFTGLAVSNDGLIAAGTESGGLVIGSPNAPDRIARTDGRPGAFSSDGSQLALTVTIAAPTSTTLELDTGRQFRHPFPSNTLFASTVRAVGWPDDRLQLLLAQESTDKNAEFVITTPKVDQTSTWRRNVGSVDPAAASTLTVAVDLIPDLDGTSSRQLTHDFGEPDWPGQRDISWMIGLGVAGALGVLYGLRWLWRRRTGLV